jgi:hypothetical protein
MPSRSRSAATLPAAVRFLLGCAAVCLVSCQPVDRPAAQRNPPSTDSTPAPAKPVEPARLTSDGWGPLRIGMTRAEVVAAAGEDAQPDAVGGPDPESCDEFHPARAPAGMRVMIERGRLTRITLSRDAEVRTEHGFRLGDPAGEIKAALGTRAVASPHEYGEPPSEYLTVWVHPTTDADPRGIVYEIGPDGRVAQIHAGGASIQYVEGCL